MDADFGKALVVCLRQVESGRVTTCGAIARALGDVRAARAVATWLVDHPLTPAGHRVIRADGRPLLPSGQASLVREGINLGDGRVPAERIANTLEPIEFLTALRADQRRLRNEVIEADGPECVERIAGVDAAYDGDAMVVAAVCLESATLTPIEIVTIRQVAEFPYVPTFLAYRESPGIEAAVQRLKSRPDVLLVDGHGRLHPERFGVACYVGVKLGVPTIGVAKHPLVGRVQTKSGRSTGASPIEFGGRLEGYAWTPPNRARPIFISAGNRISLDRSLQIVRESTYGGYPEPLKLADRVCREMKRNEKREKGATG